MKMVMRIVGVVFLMVMAAGCRREHSPEDAYRGFIKALQKGDTKKAWSSLSALTRQKLEERSRAISEASQGGVRDEPELLIFQGTRPGPLGEVSPVKADETSAVLRVASGSKPHQVKLVKESGRWRIELSDAIAATQTPPPPGALGSDHRD